MKDTGVVRRLDELGRITLPIELRKTMGLEEKDAMHIFVEDNRIILAKEEPADIFTGNTMDLITYHGKKVSRQSIEELARLAHLIPEE